MAIIETNWAVVELGGKQHLVSAGAKIKVNQLTKEVGDELELKNLLDQSPVTAKILKNFRGEKVVGLKFKNKIRYTRHYGHRQNLSELEIISIGTKAAAKPAVAKTEVKKASPKKVATKKTIVKKETK